MGNIVVSSVAKAGVVGDQHYADADVTGSSSYATGGDTLTPAALGFSQKITFVEICPTGSVANQRLWSVAHQADGSVKLLLMTALNTEVANTTNVTAISARIKAYGY